MLLLPLSGGKWSHSVVFSCAQTISATFRACLLVVSFAELTLKSNMTIGLTSTDPFAWGVVKGLIHTQYFHYWDKRRYCQSIGKLGNNWEDANQLPAGQCKPTCKPNLFSVSNIVKQLNSDST